MFRLAPRFTAIPSTRPLTILRQCVHRVREKCPDARRLSIEPSLGIRAAAVRVMHTPLATVCEDDGDEHRVDGRPVREYAFRKSRFIPRSASSATRLVARSRWSRSLRFSTSSLD